MPKIEPKKLGMGLSPKSGHLKKGNCLVTHHPYISCYGFFYYGYYLGFRCAVDVLLCVQEANSWTAPAA